MFLKSFIYILAEMTNIKNHAQRHITQTHLLILFTHVIICTQQIQLWMNVFESPLIPRRSIVLVNKHVQRKTASIFSVNGMFIVLTWTNITQSLKQSRSQTNTCHNLMFISLYCIRIVFILNLISHYLSGSRERRIFIILAWEKTVTMCTC